MRHPLITAAATLLLAATARAHFPFMAVEQVDGRDELRVYFGEAAEPGDPALLDYVRPAAVTARTPDGTWSPVKLADGDGFVKAGVDGHPDGTVYTLRHSFVTTHGGVEPFLLDYSASFPANAAAEHVAGQPLAVTAVRDGEKLRLTVSAGGKPLPDAEVAVSGADGYEGVTTGPDGTAVLSPAPRERLSLRAKRVVPGGGTRDGETFTETRRYATTVVEPVTEPTSDTVTAALPVAVVAELPEGTTSLGAAVAGGHLYTYGGHPGGAHEYSRDEQSGDFRRLDLSDPAAGFQTLPSGPKLQGLALVARDPSAGGPGVVRLGGFTARNAKGEEHDLHSRADVARFDPAKNTWEPLTPLPEPRSSFDAAVLGGRVYVVGGWSLNGDADETWHDTAWSADLSRTPLVWEPLPAPPFVRRALSVAAAGGKIFAVGGMQREGGPTRRVDVYDPASRTWSRAPDLPAPELADGDAGGDHGSWDLEGFGPGAEAVGDALVVTTLTGRVLRLTPGATEWEVLGTVDRARFFHQLLPDGDGGLLLVGGGNMTDGRFTEVDRIDVR